MSLLEAFVIDTVSLEEGVKTLYRYGAPRGEVVFYAEDRDYAEEYAYVRGGKPEDVRAVKVDVTNVMDVTLDDRKWGDPPYEKPYIEKALRQKAYSGVRFHAPGFGNMYAMFTGWKKPRGFEQFRQRYASNYAESLTEGVRDAHILKAVFVAGSGGAGKSAVADAMFSGWGLKTINQDKHLERFMKDAELPLSDIGMHYGIFKKAQKLKGKELRHYAMQRLGILVDSTGWDYKRIAEPVKKLRQLGYDTYMIFVRTSLPTALKRNLARAAKGGRDVPDSYIKTAHEGAMKNLGRYVTLFGADNIWIVDNNRDVPPQTWKSVISPALRKIGDKIARRPIRNKKGLAWVKKQQTKPDINDPDRKPEWVEPEHKPYKPVSQVSQKGGKPKEPFRTGQNQPAVTPAAARTGKKSKKGAKVPTPSTPRLKGGSVAVPQGKATVTFGSKFKGVLGKVASAVTGKKKKRKAAESIDTVSILREGD